MALIRKYRYILLLILLALALRIFLFLQIMDTIPFPDFFAYKEWIYKSYSLGLDKVYIVASNKIMDVNQPPGTIYILRGFFESFLILARGLVVIFNVDGASYWINEKLLVFFFRLPSIICDLFLGLLIYKMVRKEQSEKVSLFAAGFYLFNPLVFYNSTVWGQLESINNLLLFASLVFLINKNAFRSVFFYALSIFVKLSLLPLAPLYLLLGFSKIYFPRKKFVIGILASFLIILIMCIPYSHNPFWIIEIFFKVINGASNEITANAYNFWWLVFNPLISVPQSSIVYYGLSLNAWGYLIFSLLYIPLFYFAYKLIKKKKFNTEVLFIFMAVIAFSAFLFLPKMHERYLFPVFPLLIAWIGLKNRYWIVAIILSALHFLNLYIVWNPDLYLFWKFEEGMMTQNFKWLISALTLMVFIWLYTKLILDSKLTLKKKN